MQVLPKLRQNYSLFGFQGAERKAVGVFNDEGPPVPIPNTEVKLISAENTGLATDWKDRSMPTQSISDPSEVLFFLQIPFYSHPVS